MTERRQKALYKKAFAKPLLGRGTGVVRAYFLARDMAAFLR